MRMLDVYNSGTGHYYYEHTDDVTMMPSCS